MHDLVHLVGSRVDSKLRHHFSLLETLSAAPTPHESVTTLSIWVNAKLSVKTARCSGSLSFSCPSTSTSSVCSSTRTIRKLGRTTTQGPTPLLGQAHHQASRLVLCAELEDSAKSLALGAKHTNRRVTTSVLIATTRTLLLSSKSVRTATSIPALGFITPSLL